VRWPWLGALITNRGIIGTRYTPVRAVVDHCASMIGVPRHCFSLVVSKQGLHGLDFGTPEEAYDRAARRSAEVNVKRVPRAYHTVVSVCPAMYPELWTAGKCMYKLEPVVEPGGTLIIYAPHLAEVSKTHGRWIEEVGYHVLPYFTSQFEKFRHVPLGVLAHSTHVKGRGRYEDGVETPDVDVVLATAIPPDLCRRINLGYLDPATVDLDSYRGREAEGVLVVDRAGEVLYRVEGDRE
jgi:nickel-dependent lactate racemase